MGFSKWALVELVEAAVHAGMTQTAAGAYRRLTAMTGPAGTDWALGLAAALLLLEWLSYHRRWTT